MQFAIYLLFIVSCSISQGVLINKVEKILTGISFPQSPKNTAAIFNNDRSQLCTGALIHQSWILTSALCALKSQNHHLRVVVGETILNSTFSTAIKIKEYYIYPKFNQESLVGDIALLQLDKPADNDNQILQISNDKKDLSNTECIIKGYGYSKPTLTDKFSGNMTQGNVRLIENSFCSSYPVIMTNKLCTIETACKGDQGAPLITLDTNELIGIVSLKNGNFLCGFQAIPLTLYTKVGSYKDWITSIVHLNL